MEAVRQCMTARATDLHLWIFAVGDGNEALQRPCIEQVVSGFEPEAVSNPNCYV